MNVCLQIYLCFVVELCCIGWRDRHRDSDRDRDFRHGPKGGPSGSGTSTDWLSSLPRGTPLAPGQNCMDAISQTVASIRPGQMMEILASMKVSFFPRFQIGIINVFSLISI